MLESFLIMKSMNGGPVGLLKFSFKFYIFILFFPAVAHYLVQFARGARGHV